MMGGVPPMDPNTGMPMDPSMMGGVPPMDPNTGMPMDPSMMGGAPPQGGAMPPEMIDQFLGVMEEIAAAVEELGGQVEAIVGAVEELGGKVEDQDSRLAGISAVQPQETWGGQ